MAVVLLSVSILGLLGVMGFRRVQRSFFYPFPNAMPAVEAEDVGLALRRFQSALEKNAPEVFDALQPGLTEDELSTIQREHGLRLTEDLKALYRWRNGSPLNARVELIPGMRFLSLQDAVRERDELRRQVARQTLVQRITFEVFAGHRVGWLPVLVDVAGDGYFHDPSRPRGGGSFFYNFAEDGQYRFFPSVANFLVGAAECYETRIYSRDRDGTAIEDFTRSYILWPRYASWPRSG